MDGVRVHLAGPPFLEHGTGNGRRPHGRKAWGLLAYLVLHHAPTPRIQLAAMLFPDAVDPLGALRWHLSDLRRVLGSDASLRGDPLTLQLPPSSWTDMEPGTPLPSTGDQPLAAELIEGMNFSDCPGFDSWLTIERHRLRHRVETAAYEGGLSALAGGDTATAVQLAARALELNPLNPDFHALLVRSLVAAGDRAGARDSADRCAALFAEQLGAGLPAEVQHALAAPDTGIGTLPATRVAVRSYLEAATASLAAGATGSALTQLRVAGALAERTGIRELQAEALLSLAGALIHGAGGRGAEVSDLLHRAASLSQDGPPSLQSAAYRELGFLAVQRGFPTSGLYWLGKAEAAAEGLDDETAKALGVRGMLATDTADYPTARSALQESIRLSSPTGAVRQEAFARTMLGRVHLLTGQLQPAALELDAALTLADRDHWVAFLPLAEALRSEVHLLSGHDSIAEEMSEHATALAAAFGDRCFIDAAAHAKAKALLSAGHLDAAGSWILRGIGRNPWYRWFRGRNLELACAADLHGNPERALGYARELGELSSRYGHDELTVRAYSFLELLGDAAVGTAIPVLAGRINNPLLHAELALRNQL